jgi:hypothetical protein
MEAEAQKLKEMSVLVHAALKTLKIGETGTITCKKPFTPDELHGYVTAYGFHKNKWFEIKHDAVSNVLFCKRSDPPPIGRGKKDEDEDEVA